MVETSVFVAGVGILVTLDLSVLAISVANARQVGTDEQARELAAEAEEQAQVAHERVTTHLRQNHGESVDTARESYRRGGQ